MERAGELKEKIKSSSRKIPYASIVGVILAILGVVITAAAQSTVFEPLPTYFPDYKWATIRFFIQILLIIASIVNVIALITAFFATKYYSAPNFCASCIKCCRSCTSNVVQTLVVLLSFLVLVLTVVLFCFSAMLRMLQEAFTQACANVDNEGNGVCLNLAIYGGANVNCGNDFTSFCTYWKSDLNINSLLAGASFLLLSTMFLMSCAVSNWMRYRHNISVGIIENAKLEKGANDAQGLRDPSSNNFNANPEKDQNNEDQTSSY